MTVAELIEKLKQFNPEHQVWMSKDDEGNEYKPVGEISNFLTFEVESSSDPIDPEEEIDIYISLEQFTYADVADHPSVVMIWPGYYVRD